MSDKPKTTPETARENSYRFSEKRKICIVTANEMKIISPNPLMRVRK